MIHRIFMHFIYISLTQKEKSISKYEILVNDVHAEDFREVSDGFNFEMHKHEMDWWLKRAKERWTGV